MLRPVRRLAKAAEQMSGGDLSVRVQPQSRYDLAELTGDTAAAARLVREEILHLGRLVDDLIEISRFDAGTARLVTDETDIAAAIGGCLRARARQDEVYAAVPDALSAFLDRRRLDVIVANLVGNALRHGGPPVTVTAGLRPGGAGGAQLEVTVRHGPEAAPKAAGHSGQARSLRVALTA